MLQYPEEARLNSLEASSIIAALQGLLKQRYPIPEQRVEQGLNISLGPQGHIVQTFEQKEWHFISADRQHAIVVKPDRVLVHTVGYTDFPAFAERIREGIEAVQATLQVSQFSSVGIRTVDALCFSEKPDQLSDSAVDKILPFELARLNLQPQKSLTCNAYQTEFGRNLILKTYYSKEATPIIPADLQLLASQLFLKEPDLSGPVLLLDFDHIYTAPQATVQPLELNQLMEVVGQMHETASNAFLSTIKEDYLINVLRPARKY